LEKSNYFQIHNFPEIGKDCIYDTGYAHEKEFQRLQHFECLTEFDVIMPKKIDSNCLWDEKVKTAEREAYEKGFNLGINEGIKASQKNLAPILNKFENAIMELENTKKNLYHIAEKEAVDLSLAIAKKIVGNEVSINKKFVVNIVREAMKKVEGHEKIKIILNPSEIDVLNDAKNEIETMLTCMDKIEFETNPSISKGGCIVKTDIADIDARLEKQLQVIEDAFKSNLIQSEQ
jgi:flagellar assembly protein FliH